ncbi:TPA: aminotransferase class V-fold PLP-dependent enzyme [Klebsiella pneumoniae]
MNNAELETYRDDFPFLKQQVFLNHAAIAPISLTVRDAVLKGAEAMLHDIPLSDEKAQLVYESGRELAAALISCRTNQIAYVQNTSTAMSMIAIGIDFKPGDNVIVPAMEFPSNYLPWLQLQEKGVEIRIIDACNGRITTDEIKPYIDKKTRIVALSHVQYYNGFKVNLASVANLCHENNALLVVDGTQSAGAIKTEFERDGIDIFVAASHKWLMGPVGTGFMALSDRAMKTVKPKIVGWLSVNEPFAFHRKLDFPESATRFEAGSENCLGIYGLQSRLSTINSIDPLRIEKRLKDVVAYLIDSAHRKNDLNVVAMRDEERSGIVLLSHRSYSTEDVFNRLSDAGIKVSHRGDYIRVSPHFHNTMAEIDHLIDVISMN